jgi:hypothetical protein
MKRRPGLVRVEFFAELDPIVVLAPSPTVSFMAAIGVRYYP